MGTTGPVPKRSDQRIRRNKDEAGPVEKLEAPGEVEAPPLDLPGVHPIVQDFYQGLVDSAQSAYFEPSDWQFARFICLYMSDQITSGRFSGQMLASITSALSNLLVTEGDRRRVRLEIEREQAKAEVFDLAEEFRKRQEAG